MKILLTGAFNYTEEQIEYIKSLAGEVVFVQDERVPLTFDVSDIDAVVCNALFLYNPIEGFKSLKHIQLTSAGLDRVPLDYINEHNIKIYNARGVYSVPMAEFAICGVLQLYKQAGFFRANQAKHRWEKHRGLLELADKNVLVVGAGSIGTEAARRFKAFNSRVVGVDLYPSQNECFDSIYPIEQLDDRLSEADIVVLTLPLTEESRGLFNKERLERMKGSAIFVNIARGGLVNQEDLVNALEGRKIGGAVLDVFESEPLDESSALWDFDNVILTPHNSFVGDNNNKRMFDVIIKNLKETV